MKNFLKVMISVVLILPIVTNFNSNQNTLISINDNELAFNIERFHTSQDLAILDREYLGTTAVVDLTALTGISSIEVFKRFYWRVELPDFYAKLGLFNNILKTTSLSIATTTWVEDWVSETIKLLEGSETIGSAYIYGLLTARVDIKKDPDINHLLFRLHFYGKGNVESSGKHPMGDIDTLWVMKLITR